MMLGKEEDRKPIGLFFGSFNPIHNGHVGIARYLLEKSYVRKCGLWSVPVIRLKWIVFFCWKRIVLRS